MPRGIYVHIYVEYTLMKGHPCWTSYRYVLHHSTHVGFSGRPFSKRGPLAPRKPPSREDETQGIDMHTHQNVEEMNKTSHMSHTHITRVRFDQVEPIGHISCPPCDTLGGSIDESGHESG